MYHATMYILLAFVAAALHFIWESLHIHLYTGYESLGGGIPITAYATAGDVIYTVAAVLAVAAFKRKLDWMRDATRANFASLAIIGFCIACFVEYKALVFDRWAYTWDMPIIPLLNIGLSPMLQMAILLPMSVWLASNIVGRISINTG